MPVAYVVFAEGAYKATIRAPPGGQLAHCKLAQHVVLVAATPNSASGKILRRMLPAP